jgi:hypothetical protein
LLKKRATTNKEQMDSAKRKKAGPFKQILILLWKNWILFRRNKFATVIEIGVAYLFVIVLGLFRIFIDSPRYKAISSLNDPEISVASLINITSNRTMLSYYPPNEFIRKFVTNALALIKQAQPKFNATGEY